VGSSRGGGRGPGAGGPALTNGERRA
jgi:hypothetical protein